jgi:hypothetical protein
MYLRDGAGEKYGMVALWEPKQYRSKGDMYYLKEGDRRIRAFWGGEFDRLVGHGLTRTPHGRVVLDIRQKVDLLVFSLFVL